MRIFFMRHAASFKSTEDRHGGKGLPLTDQGKQDIIDLIYFLENQENIIFQESFLYCSDLVQVIETAKIIEDEKVVSFQISSHIKNISLGVLDGLSKAEALKKFPNEATNLELWRKTKK